MADFGKAEWGGILTIAAGGCAAVWRWLMGRRREAEDLDDSRMDFLGKSLAFQSRFTDFLEQRFKRLTDENDAFRLKLEKLEEEHAACERATAKLTRQNEEQAQQIETMRREIDSLRQQINQPRLRAV